jgi:N-acetylglucosaminyldiphosphoundecaprenol N-acetyl-beta-D-mannosaminyltransferase
MLALCERSLDRGYKHFFYGGGEGVAERLATALARRYPGLDIAGSHTPPFRALTDSEDAAAVDLINGSGADIVWVGLSTPKQERWMAEHLGRITLFRLFSEPRRLWRRYLILAPRFVILAGLQLLGFRRFRRDP